MKARLNIKIIFYNYANEILNLDEGEIVMINPDDLTAEFKGETFYLNPNEFSMLH